VNLQQSLMGATTVKVRQNHWPSYWTAGRISITNWNGWGTIRTAGRPSCVADRGDENYEEVKVSRMHM
jgi:hypothetical protein